MEDNHKDEAFVTLATNDSYAIGALVLGSSLRAVSTTRSLAIMITQGVSTDLRKNIEAVFNVVVVVNLFDSQDAVNLELLSRPELGVTFTKLHCWRLTQFSKCVFLDSDTLVLQNIDELFDKEELSAAPDVGWPDCFNSGLFVYRPSLETYSALLNLAITKGSFDGGDQGLLNLFFDDWATKNIKNRLSFVYNVVSQEFYTYQPAFKQYGKNAKVVHFIGSVKPWHTSYDASSGHVTTHGDLTHRMEFLQLWWKTFTEHVQPILNTAVVTCVEQLVSLSLSDEQLLNESQRQYNWERGEIDYLGADSFDSILTRLNAKITSSDTVVTDTKSTSSKAKPAEEAKVTKSLQLQPSGAI